jgi:hypothetical protein
VGFISENTAVGRASANTSPAERCCMAFANGNRTWLLSEATPDCNELQMQCPGTLSGSPSPSQHSANEEPEREAISQRAAHAAHKISSIAETSLKDRVTWESETESHRHCNL